MLTQGRVLLSSGYSAPESITIRQTNSQNSQCHFIVHHRRQSRRNIFSFFLPSFLFITPCRGEAKWSNSLPLKAHMTQTLLVFISHSSSQQDAHNQINTLIFTCTQSLMVWRQKNKFSYPYFTDEDTEEEREQNKKGCLIAT